MSWLDFFAAVIQAVSWPVAFCLAAYWFRAEIRGLIKSLRVARVKVSGTEVEFIQAVESAEKEIRDLGIEDEPVPEQFERLLQVDPNYAVLDAWKELETSLVKLSVGKFQNPPRWPPGRHLSHLVQNGQISPDLAYALQELREARNQIVHDKEYTLSKTAARRFIDIAMDVVGSLAGIP